MTTNQLNTTPNDPGYFNGFERIFPELKAADRDYQNEFMDYYENKFMILVVSPEIAKLWRVPRTYIRSRGGSFEECDLCPNKRLQRSTVGIYEATVSDMEPRSFTMCSNGHTFPFHSIDHLPEPARSVAYETLAKVAQGMLDDILKKK